LPLQHKTALFSCLLSGRVTTTSRLLDPKLGMALSVIFKGTTTRYRIGGNLRFRNLSIPDLHAQTLGLGTHLFVKVLRLGDSEVTFSVFESN